MGSNRQPSKRHGASSTAGRYAVKRLWQRNLTADLTSRREGIGRIASVHCSTKRPRDEFGAGIQN